MVVVCVVGIALLCVVCVRCGVVCGAEEAPVCPSIKSTCSTTPHVEAHVRVVPVRSETL